MKVSKFLSGLVALVAGGLALYFTATDKNDGYVLGGFVLTIAFILDCLLSIIMQKSSNLSINKGFRITNIVLGVLVILISYGLDKGIAGLFLMMALFYLIPVGILVLTEIKRKDNGLAKLFSILLGVLVFAFFIVMFGAFMDIKALEKLITPAAYIFFGVITLKGLLDLLLSFRKAKEQPQQQEVKEEQPQEAAQ